MSQQIVYVGNKQFNALDLVVELIAITDAMAVSMVSASNGGGPVASLVKEGIKSKIKLTALKVKLKTML